MQGANLLVWLLSPLQTTRIRIFAVKSLLNEPRSKELFKNLVYINPQVCGLRVFRNKYLLITVLIEIINLSIYLCCFFIYLFVSINYYIFLF